MGTITIVGLGPADASLLAPNTLDALARHERRFLRTVVHPAAAAVVDATAFDEIYDAAPDFATVYEAIAERLIAEAADGDLVYAVPGSPLVLERTVELLRAAENDGRVVLDILPAMSFLDVAWARLRIDPVESSVRLIDGHVFAEAAAGQTGPLLVAHCHSAQVLSDIKLSLDDGPTVVVLQRLGLPDERIFEMPWHELDREVDADHLTSLWIPELETPVAAEFARFEELVRVLRDECPWDRKQTHASLRQHLLEETHETLEAIDARAARSDDEVDDELDTHLAEELGDLLYQVFFHARLAAERGSFTIADVAEGIHDKLVTRHPHVFGDTQAGDADQVVSNWEELKRAEKGRASAMDGIPPALPALLLALKVQTRAAGTGFDWKGGPEVAYADVEDELAEVRDDPSEHEVGDLLFAAVQVARRLDLDPESALRGAAQRFQQRFRVVEELAAAAGTDLAEVAGRPDGETHLGDLWSRAKERETH
ncbi:MAG: nucleoside triphosphate pyrophosphohydrolase [Acidimicrobiales bacterium]